MKKTNVVIIIAIILLVMLYIGKIIYTNTEINNLHKKIDKLQERIDIVSDELFVTKGILNGHITGELSEDIGGEY